MRKSPLIALPICASILASPAQAQMMPGVKAPDSASTAMLLAQLVGCTFAAAGRPTPVSSERVDESMGLAFHEAAPAAFLAASGMEQEGTLAFTVANPEGEVWVLNNPRERRCAVATLAGDLSATEATFVSDFDKGMMDYRPAKTSQAGIRRYISKTMGLSVTIKASTGEADPLVVTTEKMRK